MVNRIRRNLMLGVPTTMMLGAYASVAQAPLRLEITEGVIEPMPFAAPAFVADNAQSAEMAGRITQVVVDDLVGTGLFREVPRAAHIGSVTNFETPVQYSDWTAINAQALVTGAVAVTGETVAARFRLWDVFGQAQLGDGLLFEGPAPAWRRLGHKIADQVYMRLTGEGGYFDSRVTFIAESGSKSARTKQLSVMDYDGANARSLTDGGALVLAPRFSNSGQQILFTSYAAGAPQVYLMDAAGSQTQVLEDVAGMTFAPRFSPDGSRAVFSATASGGTDLFVTDLGARTRIQLTRSSSIDTAPCFSPDASEIVFESDRGGTQQLYVMSAEGGDARRISFGDGRYATPVWSPRGDLIAFTKITGGRFHIGVMRLDGSDEKLLTASFLDEGPTWAPNGRVIMFFRESPGETGGPNLYSVDITGRNLRMIPTQGFASDPSWSGLLG